MKMKNFKLLVIVLSILSASVFIQSCAKDEKPAPSKQNVSNRTTVTNCDPETLFPENTNCTSVQRNVQISFALGNTLYSTGSMLAELCPGLTVDVSYTYTSCLDENGDPVNFIHNVEYDLDEILSDCPDLDEKLQEQVLFNNHTPFLDMIEFDISKQIEFTEAYNTISASPTTYDCESGTAIYSVKAIANSCFQWGYGVVNYPETGPYYFFTREDCDAEVCCTRSGFYCFEGYTLDGIGLTSSNSYDDIAFGECPEECTHECGQPGNPIED